MTDAAMTAPTPDLGGDHHERTDSAEDTNDVTPFSSQQSGFSQSISQTIELRGSNLKAPGFLSWIERPFQVPVPETGERLPEATGWAMGAAGRSPLNQVGSYVGSAILRLAQIDAGCTTPRTACEGTVYGFKPSSLLTMSSSIVGITAAILMPIIGAVVDYSTCRRLLGIVSGLLAVVFVGFQMIIGNDTWFAVLIVDGIQSFALLVHVTVAFAYLPDLTTDEEVLSHYTSRFNLRQFSLQFIYVCLVILVTVVRDLDPTLVSTSVQNARDAAGMAFGFGVLLIGYAWLFLFRDRPALHEIPENQNLLNSGFIQLRQTIGTIWRRYPALRWFMFSLLFSPESGAGVVLSIAVTFLTVSIEIRALELAQALLLLQVGNLVGALFSKLAVSKVNPLNSYRLALTSIGIGVGAAALHLDGPDKKKSVLGFALLWGFSMGWTYPSQRVLFCTLIPKGQETEMMGLFAFVGQILGWLPPLLFTIMNENGVDLRWGLGLITYFCFFAVLCTIPMGNYNDAVALATRESESRRQKILKAVAPHDIDQNVATTRMDSIVSFEER